MMRRLWVVMIAGLMLLLTATPALAADGSNGGRVVFGQDFVLGPDQTVDGDLGVLGGSATLQAGSRVDGDMVVMGGSVTAEGDVTGDVVVIGGNVHLDPTASIEGDLMIFGGNVTGSMETVEGTISHGFSIPNLPSIRAPRTPALPGMRWTATGNPVLNWFLRGMRAVGAALVLGLIALLVVTLWPSQVELVSKTLWHSPGQSFGIGFLTYLVVIGLIVLLAVTICLSPVAVLLAVATSVAFVFGWMALGWIVGDRILKAVKAGDAAAIWRAALGAFLITVLGAIPCLGWLVWVVGGAFGLGAVVLTRFGTRRYNGSGPATSVESPSSELELLPPVVLDLAEVDAQDPSEPDDASIDVEGSDPTSAEPTRPQEGAGDDAESMPEQAVEGPADVDEERPDSLAERVPEVGADDQPLRSSGVRLEAGSGEAPDVAVGATLDDLEQISGIGPVFAARLRAQGITSFAQLAEADPGQLAEIVELFPERVIEDDWIGQAKEKLA